MFVVGVIIVYEVVVRVLMVVNDNLIKVSILYN